MWKHKRGVTMQASVTVGGSGLSLSAGDPVKYSSGVVVAATDGARVDGVMHDDGDTGDQVFMDLLVPGSIWEAPCSSLTAAQGVQLVAAGSSAVDGGTSGDPSFGRVVDDDVASTDTTVKFVVERGTIA